MKKLFLVVLMLFVFATPILSGQKGAYLFLNCNTAFVDGQKVYLPVPMTEINGQIMVPLDIISNFTNSRYSYENGCVLIEHSKPEVFFDNKSKKPLLELIHNAKNSISIQMFDFTDDDVALALISAKNSNPNIEINCMLDDTLTNQNVSNRLKEGTIKVKFDKKSGVQFHRKLAIFDNETIWIGSTNWSKNGFSKNSEVDVSIFEPLLAQKINSQMDLDFTTAAPEYTGKKNPCQTEDATYFVASSKSTTYHKPCCYHAKNISPQNFKKYDSEEDAMKDGKNEKCKNCFP